MTRPLHDESVEGSPTENREQAPPSVQQREAAYQQFVDTNLRRNYLGNYFHGMLGMTGFRLVNAPTFLPAYLFIASGSNAIVGLGLALQQAGGIVSPIIAGNRIEHRPKVMPVAMLMGILSRLAVLGIALAGWLLTGQSLVLALLGFIFLFGLFMGAQRVVFSLLISKVIPISIRGRLQAWRNATGGLIAAVLAYIAGKYFIGGNMLGNGYATTFLCAFVLTSLGLLTLQILIREPATPTLRKQLRFVERLREFPALVTQRPDFGWFLLVQMLATAGNIATPFYILYVGRLIDVDGATLGLLSLAFLGAGTVSNLVWGYLGDHTGFRLILILSLLCWLTATVLLMSTSSLPLIFLAFFGFGSAQAGYMMGAQTIILEFGEREDLPMRIALSTTAESITATIGPLAGGWAADQLGYGFVFGVSIILLAAALVLLTFAVGEPRRSQRRGS